MKDLGELFKAVGVRTWEAFKARAGDELAHLTPEDLVRLEEVLLDSGELQVLTLAGQDVADKLELAMATLRTIKLRGRMTAERIFRESILEGVYATAGVLVRLLL